MFQNSAIENERKLDNLRPPLRMKIVKIVTNSQIFLRTFNSFPSNFVFQFKKFQKMVAFTISCPKKEA